MNIKQAVPFFAVSNMGKSVGFYVDGLGFEITQKWVDDGNLRWCTLQHGGGLLMLQEFATEGHDSWVPTGKVGEGVTIYFNCVDALALHQDIIGQNIEAHEPFVGNGMWVVSVSDPDGYKLVFQSDTDVPEGTKLSEWIQSL